MTTVLHFTGALAALAAMLSCVAADCGFHADCRPGETYQVAIPCEGKCSSYVQCADGVATEKRCGKYFFVTKNFDPVKLECVRDTVDCDWWKKIVTTTAAPPTTPTAATSTPAPETTPSTSTTETAPTSTEASSTAAPDTTAQPSSSTSAPSSSPPPPAPTPADSAAAPLAAAAPALLAAAVALLL